MRVSLNREWIALALAIVTVSVSAQSVTDLPVGLSTPAFTLPTVAGAQVSLSNEYGQPIVLLFADLKQEHSRQALAEMVDVISQGDVGDDLKVFVIVDSAPEVAPALGEFTLLLDTDRATFAAHGVVSVLPCAVFLDSDGMLHHAMAGHSLGFADEVEDEILYLTGRISDEELTARRAGPDGDEIATAALIRRVNLADQLRMRGMPERAKLEYEAVLTESPSDTGAHLGLALIAMRQPDMETAATHCQAALAQNPDLPLANKALAFILLAQGQMDEVETTLSRYTAVVGEDAETRYLRGRLAESRGDQGGAAEHYRQASEGLLSDREWGIFVAP